MAGPLERVFVWLGGAAFVASLAWCGYALIVTWGEARPFAGRAAGRAIAIDSALFVLFAGHHSLLARDSAKAALARAVPKRLLRSAYVWVASLLFVVLIAGWQSIGGVLYDAPGWLAMPHILMQVAGLWMIAQAVRAIDGLELAGIRPATKAGGLQARGLYALVRHPVYFGTLLIVFGFARMTGDRLLFAVLVTVYLVTAVPWEERSLERTFGEEYRRYREQVRWRIVPFLY
jgi:protein-S-isoprenylcysteine O-methyltransferase Ste14